MGVIAIHRHITLSCPHRAYNSTSGPSGGNLSAVRAGTACRLGAMTVVVWLVAAILAVPHSMFNQIVYVPWRNVTYVRCRAEYPKWDEKFNLPFWLSVEAFLTQYLIPLSITCTLYIKIGFVVSKQGRLASNSNNRRKKEQDDARRRRIIMPSKLQMLKAGVIWLIGTDGSGHNELASCVPSRRSMPINQMTSGRV
ncbi:hypothetical protein TYRP_013501 [Tyrophagus putrescentiae]|nr:hypothetical protein TYRP_000007 [Tyrophagus putrescentiae]KAH9406520.1 hypothetical protein TYRP_013501 [Tyrophagus putrescentiae]